MGIERFVSEKTLEEVTSGIGVAREWGGDSHAFQLLWLCNRLPQNIWLNPSQYLLCWQNLGVWNSDSAQQGVRLCAMVSGTAAGRLQGGLELSEHQVTHMLSGWCWLLARGLSPSLHHISAWVVWISSKYDDWSPEQESQREENTPKSYIIFMT